MNKFLEQYKVKIKTLAPVFIGSGKTLTKKEYLYNQKEKKVTILNFGKVFSDVKTGKTARELRNYFMKEDKKGLKEFLNEKDITVKSEWIESEYSVDGAESVFVNDKFKGIDLIVKDPCGNPYIPGSSLKGAIRTSLIKYKIHGEADVFEDSKNVALNIIEKKKNPKKDLSKHSKNVEDKVFSISLSAKKRNGQVASYDIMKGLIIRDSKPLPTSSLTICQKIDRKQNADENNLPILRECIRPETEIEFSITIDRTYFKESIEEIKKAIQYSYQSNRNWIEKLLPNELLVVESSDLLYIGGGVGYVSKTVTYDLLAEDDAKTVALKSIPAPGKQKRDDDSFVPRTIKKTMLNGEYYDMGLCSIEFERIE